MYFEQPHSYHFTFYNESLAVFALTHLYRFVHPPIHPPIHSSYIWNILSELQMLAHFPIHPPCNILPCSFQVCTVFCWWINHGLFTPCSGTPGGFLHWYAKYLILTHRFSVYSCEVESPSPTPISRTRAHRLREAVLQRHTAGKGSKADVSYFF